MEDFFTNKMASLGFALPEGSTPPSEELVAEFEQRFELELPKDFRTFLVKLGGVRGIAACEMLEPTPFGTSVCIDCFYGFQDDEIGDSTELIEGAPDVIALGNEPLGRMFFLFLAEPYAGHVFVRDHYGRSSWTDEQFFQWPNLAPEIHLYLDLRREGTLPEKPAGFEDVYLVATSFTDFVQRLEPFSSE